MLLDGGGAAAAGAAAAAATTTVTAARDGWVQEPASGPPLTHGPFASVGCTAPHTMMACLPLHAATRATLTQRAVPPPACQVSRDQLSPDHLQVRVVRMWVLFWGGKGGGSALMRCLQVCWEGG